MNTTKTIKNISIEEFELMLSDAFKDNSLRLHLEPEKLEVQSVDVFSLFKCLTVYYSEADNEWNLNFTLNDMQNVLLLLNSELGIKEFLEGVEYVIGNLNNILPTVVTGSSVNSFNERFRKMVLICHLHEELKKRVSYPLYINNRGEIIISEFDISLEFSTASIILNTQDYDNGVTKLWIPYNKNTSLNTVLAEDNLVNIINSLCLQKTFNSSQHTKDIFKDKFNKLFGELFFAEHRNIKGMDFYSQAKKINPNADLYSEYYLIVDVSVSAKYFDRPSISYDWTYSISDPQTKVLKTLSGLYYVKDTEDALGFISLDDYEKIKKK